MTFETGVSVLDQQVHLTVEITGPGTLSDRAAGTIRQLLAREGERIAQIAGVDVRDQARYAADAARLTGEPADRPHTLLLAGVKGPEGQVVIKGE